VPAFPAAKKHRRTPRRPRKWTRQCSRAPTGRATLLPTDRRPSSTCPRRSRRRKATRRTGTSTKPAQTSSRYRTPSHIIAPLVPRHAHACGYVQSRAVLHAAVEQRGGWYTFRRRVPSHSRHQENPANGTTVQAKRSGMWVRARGPVAHREVVEKDPHLQNPPRYDPW
jgi:hypothetical protein